MLHQLSVHVIWVPKLKISVFMCGKKIEFFVNYDECLQQSKKFHYEALKTLKML